jgi:hypothetical protein
MPCGCVSAGVGMEVERETYSECEVGAVAEMHSLEHAGRNGPTRTDLLWLRERQYAAVCYGRALDEAYALQLGECR